MGPRVGLVERNIGRQKYFRESFYLLHVDNVVFGVDDEHH